jgi:hypothetical protein
VVSLCVLGIRQTTDNGQQNMGITTETLVDCDRFITFHPFYEYESCTFAFVTHDFPGYALLCYLKGITTRMFERLSCVTKKFQLTTEFT